MKIITIADGVRICLETFEGHIARTETCWIWTARVDRWGYGQYSSGPAHRVAYRIWVGPIAEGLTVDHLCYVPACVNPAHLRLLPAVENMSAQRSAFKTHCASGHEFTPENTYQRTGGGRRQCRACNAKAARKYAARKRVA